MVNFLGCIGSTYGVLYIELLEYFGESNGATAWPGSINLGLGLAAGKYRRIKEKRPRSLYLDLINRLLPCKCIGVFAEPVGGGESIGLEIERFRVHSLVPSGFSLRPGN